MLAAGQHRILFFADQRMNVRQVMYLPLEDPREKTMAEERQPLTLKVETARGVRTLTFPDEIVAQGRGVPRTVKCYAMSDEVRMVRIEARRADGLRFNVLDEYNQPLNDAPVQWEIIWR